MQSPGRVLKTAEIVPLQPRRPDLCLPQLFCDTPAEIMPHGRTMFWEGDEAKDVFLIDAGALRLCRGLSDGRRAIVGFMLPGEILGLAAGAVYPYSAEAIDEVKLRRMPRRRLIDDMDRDATLRPQAFMAISNELTRAQDQILLLGRKTADERVASFLLSMAERTGAAAREISLPMTRLDMADYLGLTIETVSRVLTRLQREGLIAFTSRYDLGIRRQRELRERAGWDDNPAVPAGPASRWN